MKAKKVRITDWGWPHRRCVDSTRGSVSKRTFGEFIQGLCDDLDKQKVRYEIKTNSGGQIALFTVDQKQPDKKRKGGEGSRESCPNCGSDNYRYAGKHNEFRECISCGGYKWAVNIERSVG